MISPKLEDTFMDIPTPVWVAVVGAISTVVVALIQRNKNKDDAASAPTQAQIYRA